MRSPRFAILDTETTGLIMHRKDLPERLNFRVDGRNEFHDVSLGRSKRHALKRFRQLAQQGRTFVAHFWIFDYFVIAQMGHEWREILFNLPAKQLFCTQSIFHTWYPQADHSLEGLARDILLKERFIKQQYDRLSEPYMAWDLETTEALYRVALAMFVKMPGLAKYFTKLVQPIVPIAARMRWEGLDFDAGKADRLQVKITGEIFRTMKSIRSFCQFPDNFKHTQRGKIAEWWQNYWNVRLPRTKSETNPKPSMSKEALSLYTPSTVDESKALKLFQQAFTLQGAIQNLNRYANEVCADGKLHPEYNPCGPITGRFSCSDPNVENIPKREEKFGKDFRVLFYPKSKGLCLIATDLKQIEMCLFAHYTEDETLIRVMSEPGGDPHIITRNILRTVLRKWDASDTDQRETGKHTNYGMLYGGKLFAIMRTIFTLGHYKATHRQIRNVMKLWDRKFPQAALFHLKVADEVHDTGGVTNEFGQWIPVSRSKTYVGVNYLIQSTVACIVRSAMLLLAAKGIPICNQIHDEIWCGPFRLSEAHDLVPVITECMCAESHRFRIPVRSETSILRTTGLKGGETDGQGRATTGSRRVRLRRRGTKRVDL